MRNLVVASVLMIVLGIAFYVASPVSGIAAALAGLGATMLFALTIAYVIEALPAALGRLVEWRRQRRTEADVAAAVLHLAETIKQTSQAGCAIQQAQLAALKGIEYNLDWLGGWLEDVYGEGLFVKPIRSDVAMAMAAGNSNTRLGTELQRLYGQPARVPSRSPIEEALSHLLEQLHDVGLHSRYMYRLKQEAFVNHDLSLPDSVEALPRWLGEIAAGRVPVKMFGPKGKAALLKALEVMNRVS